MTDPLIDDVHDLLDKEKGDERILKQIFRVSYVKFDGSQIPMDSSSTLSIQTDLSAYQKGDIISISGTSNASGKINLSIENQEGQLVWSEQISVKSDGRFSTLAIAGGSGWDKSGTFTIKV